jgi:ABC-type phosphate transport system substrate-binding protein
MSAKPLFGLLLAATIMAPGFAQTAPGVENTGRSAQEEYQRGYATTPMPNQAAINAAGAPATAALNNQVASTTQANNAEEQAQYQESQAEYDADRQAYIEALVKHDAAVNRTDARYVRQQAAYADAMRVWRRQVWACKHGHQRACDMPPPNPAAFY